MQKVYRFRTALLGPGLDPTADVWIATENGRISDIGTGSSPVDVPYHPSAVAMPGLVDCHVHLALSGGADVEAAARSIDAPALHELVLANARQHLQSGVTTVRDLGSPNNTVLAALDNGKFDQSTTPRVVAAGAVSSSNGHGNFLAVHADTIEGYVRAAEEIAARGGTFMKLFATGGVITAGTVPGATQMDKELLLEVCKRARSLGLRTAAHAHGREGILNALEAGVDSIEHFSYLTNQDLPALSGSSSTLVCTLVATERFVNHEDRRNATPETLEKIEAHAPHERLALQTAVQAGVSVAVGTDAGTTFNPHGLGMQEQAGHLVLAGLQPREVLRAITIQGAELLKQESGCLEIGRYADILCLDEDPTADTAALYKINDVILDGISSRR